MAYTINKFNGTELIVLEDGTINTSTSLGLVGRNYVGYGETQNENFVFLLENFANTAPPARPLKGQTWFNSTSNLLHVYDGTKWAIVGAAVLSTTAPEGPSVGQLWLRTTDNTLHVWTAAGWAFIGPEAVAGFGTTRARSTSLLDTTGTSRPVILLTVNGIVIAICSSIAFTIAASNAVEGFLDLETGITLSSLRKVKGSLVGNATSATFLENPRTINGVSFNGGSNITVKSSTTNRLIKGDYLTGSDFDGSSEITWAVDGTSSNIIGKVVVRNSSGGFAAGTITADLVGAVTGNVTAASGTSTFNRIVANEFIGPTLSGNAFSATKLVSARTINGVLFDGTANITVPASAQTLTGTFINPSVSESNLSTVGLLTNLNVADAGINVGSQFKMLIDGAVPTIRVTATNKKINFDIADTSQPGAVTDLSFIPASESLALGGLTAPAFIPDTEGVTNLGHPTAVWNKIYANNLIGNADTATLATSATNVVGGGAGAIPYQTATSTTGMLAVGTPGQILKAAAGNTLVWANPTFEGLTPGSYLALKNTITDIPIATYDGSSATPVTIFVDATSANTGSKIVARDASGNFAAGTITANLTGIATNAAASSKISITNDTTPITTTVVSGPYPSTAVTWFALDDIYSVDFTGWITVDTSPGIVGWSNNAIVRSSGSTVATNSSRTVTSITNGGITYTRGALRTSGNKAAIYTHRLLSNVTTTTNADFLNKFITGTLTGWVEITPAWNEGGTINGKRTVLYENGGINSGILATGTTTYGIYDTIKDGALNVTYQKDGFVLPDRYAEYTVGSTVYQLRCWRINKISGDPFNVTAYDYQSTTLSGTTTGYLTFVSNTSGNDILRINTGMSYNAATNVLNTTAVNAQFSTTRTAFDNSTRIATTAYVDNMLSKIPNKLVISDPQPNLTSPSAQYADLINAYLPANTVTVGATFDFIINVVYAATTTSVSGGRWINAYAWGSLSVGATTTLYNSATGFKLIYSSNGTTWNYTGAWSYV